MSIAPPRSTRPGRARPTRRPLAVAVRGKGLGQAIGRAATVGGRYGITTARMLARLDHLVAVLDRFDATATLPITAAAVARHPRALDRYVARGIEFAVHGLHHVDHVGLDADDQRGQVQRACDVLADAGIAVTGFRAPYLRADDATLAAVRAAGLVYDASPAVHWPLPIDVDTDTYRRGLAFYGAAGVDEAAVLPWVEDGLVRIPYSLPDDESLVERLHLDPARIARVWLAMFEQAHAAGSLLTVSLHPERIGPCAEGIAAVLEAARQRGSDVWVTTLGEVARWWLARGQADMPRWPGGARSAVVVTGDVDALTVGDFAWRLAGR